MQNGSCRVGLVPTSYDAGVGQDGKMYAVNIERLA